jgi:TolA-binding protein
MSEDKSRASHHVEDLSVLARRGALSAADERAFKSALEASATLATAHQLGLDFDRVAAVKPGDEALIAEVAARTVSRGRRGAFARFRLRALLLAATLALAGSATAFWQLSRKAVDLGAATSATPSSTPAASANATRGRAPNEAPSAASATLDPVTPPVAPALVGANANALRVPGAPSAPTAPGARAEEPTARTFDSAESLFREANSARRAGDVAVARALYLRLEHDFPASDEAHLAHISLGNLLLGMGRASEAEQQFATYLGGRATLAQEALVGRAQSLAALGRTAEEQRVWQALLRDYPNSLYAGRAKQRLAELARSAAGAE